MQYTSVYIMRAAAPLYDGTPVVAKSYPQQAANTSIAKGGAAPYNTSFSGVLQPTRVPQGRKLLDQFRGQSGHRAAMGPPSFHLIGN